MSDEGMEAAKRCDAMNIAEMNVSQYYHGVILFFITVFLSLHPVLHGLLPERKRGHPR